MNLDSVIASRDHKTIYRDGDRCIKVFHADDSKADVLNEALNQARIEETGLNIPKVLEVTAINGQWAIVSEFIEGKTLAQLMEENPEKKGEYMELLVDLQMSIHQKTCPLLNKLKDKMIRNIAETEFDATTRYDLHMRLKGMPRQNQVCHGDFNPSNILISTSGVPYILDWSHATQGHAFADVARTYFLFCLNGDTSDAELYLDTFCQKSKVEKASVQKWMAIVAASQSVKGDEKERQFLVNWVSTADYM